MKTRRYSKAGFTLMEVMVAVTISAFILTSAYAAIISMAKGSEGMINYSEMNSQTRRALETFGRDIRMARNVSSFSSTKLTLLREVYDPGTDDYDDIFITYEYIPEAGTFIREQYSSVLNGTGKPVIDSLTGTEILLYDVEEINLIYYRLVNTEGSVESSIAKTLLEIKHVQIEAKLERSVLNITNTNYIISARFMMRNKNVS